MDEMRLFVAIEFSNEVKEGLLKTISDLKSQGVIGNFTRSENLHVTLAFIGETSRAVAAKACLERIEFSGFELTVGGSGNFGDLYWVGIEKNPSLSALASVVRKELLSAGFAIDEKPFKPHITVARRLSSANPPKVFTERRSMRVSEIVLMRSERINGKLVYAPVFRKRLNNV